MSVDSFKKMEQIGDNQEKEIEKKKWVDLVFTQFPELNKIGTEEEYSEYLDSIFPNSPYKEIVFHGSDKKFESFDNKLIGLNTSPDILNYYGKRFHFSTSPSPGYGKHVIPVVINPDPEFGEYPTENSYENPKVENSDQVHILGTTIDIEGFKKFIDSRNK